MRRIMKAVATKKVATAARIFSVFMSKPIILLAAFLVLTALVWLVLSPAPEIQQKEIRQQESRAPDFQLKDYKGNTVSLNSLRGKPLIINSWAVWCPFCVKELRDFTELQKEFGNTIVIIAIDRAESPEKTKQYTDDLGVTDALVFLLDPGDDFYKSIGGFSMPETIFVDKEGNIVFHKRGPMDLSEMRDKTKSLFSL